MNVFLSVLIGVHRTCMIPEEHHTVRAPVFNRVREDTDIHERAPCLPRTEVTHFAPRMPQPERGLARHLHRCRKVQTRSIVFRSPSDVGVDVLTPNLVCSNTEESLVRLAQTHSRTPVTSSAAPRRTKFGSYRPEVITGIHHGKPIDIHGAL